ncbi:MAG: hypothetical protein ACMUHX_08330 [bacterium]
MSILKCNCWRNIYLHLILNNCISRTISITLSAIMVEENATPATPGELFVVYAMQPHI